MDRHKLKIMALGIIFPFLLFGAENRENISIKLNAFSGHGSILLTWDMPEHEIINSIRIFRSINMMSTYEIIDLGGVINDRYLDVNLLTDDLLFYKVELETIDGSIFSSSHETPAFAKSKDLYYHDNIISELKENYPVTILTISEITNIHEFESLLIHDYLLRYSPFVINEMDMLQMYLLMEKIRMDSFLNMVSIKDFRASAFLFTSENPSSMLEYVENGFTAFEPLIRQRILFTPEEWNNEKINLIKLLDIKLSESVNIYDNDSDFLETLPPVRMTNLLKDSIGIKIGMHQLHNINNTIELRMDDKFLPVWFENDDPQMITIPDDWVYVDLMIAGDVVQSLPIVNESGLLSITLNDQYIFSDEITDLQVMRSIPKQDFQLNEIAYNNMDKKLQVEVAGNTDWTTLLGLFINDSLLWEWNSLPGFEVNFVDSNWVIQTAKGYSWLHLCIVNENNEWDIIESRPLFLNASFHESKVPDFGLWTTLSFSSFGESNDITKGHQNKLLIPEMFALYQNYPNPFNSSTNITFDLLKEANVTLFVADARGRKLQVFLEEIFLEKGFYSFDWSAEYQSSGIYFITLQAQSDEHLPVIMSRKMIYLK